MISERYNQWKLSLTRDSWNSFEDWPCAQLLQWMLAFLLPRRCFYMPGKGKMQVFCKIPFSDVGMQNRNFICGSILVVGVFHIFFSAMIGHVTETNPHRRENIQVFKKLQSGIREQERVFVGEKSNKFTQVILVPYHLYPLLYSMFWIQAIKGLLMGWIQCVYVMHQQISTGSQPGLSGFWGVVFWFRLAG